MTKQVKAGNVLIGGGAPVSVQSMTNTDTRDFQATSAQIEHIARLYLLGHVYRLRLYPPIIFIISLYVNTIISPNKRIMPTA